MLIIISSVVIAIMLFLCAFLEIKQFNRYETRYENRVKDCERLESNCLNSVELLRKESLESYKKGLFDGLAINKNNTLVVDHNPIKTIKEHQTIVKETEEQTLKEKELAKEEEKYQKDLQEFMSYTGDVADEE